MRCGSVSHPRPAACEVAALLFKRERFDSKRVMSTNAIWDVLAPLGRLPSLNGSLSLKEHMRQLRGEGIVEALAKKGSGYWLLPLGRLLVKRFGAIK